MAILEIIQVGLLIWGTYKYLTREKPRGPGKEPFNEQSLPRNQEGTGIPLIYGTVRVRAPVLAHFFGYGVEPNSYGDGYHYGANMMFILGIPPKQNQVSTLTRMWLGDLCLNDYPPGGDLALVFEPILAGLSLQLRTYHPPPDGGGVIGNYAALIAGEVMFTDGTGYGGVYAHYVTRFTDAGFDSTLLPHFKGMLRVMLTDWPPPAVPLKPAGFIWGDSPSIDPLSWEVECKPYFDEDLAESYYKTAGLAGGINPIGVIHDMLTSKWGKVGLPESRLDLPTFTAAADVLNTEAHGFSLVIYDPIDATEVIREVCAEIDAVVYEEPTTRQVRVKLIREDDTVGLLPLFDDGANDNVVSVLRFESQSWQDTYNQVRLTYLDRERDYTEQVAMAHDSANIAAVTPAGRLRTLEVSYLGITSAALAAKIAARELRAVSTPLKKVRLAVNRDGYTIRPGDCIRWTSAKYGITEMVLRILDVDFGELEDNRIVLECVQDRFAVSYSIFDPPDEYGFPPEPIVLPPPVAVELVEEAPRFVQARARDEGILPDITLQHLMYLAAPNPGDAGYRGNASAASTGGTEVWDTPDRNFPLRATVETEVSATSGPYDTVTGIRVSNVVGGTIAAASVANIASYGYNLVLIGDDPDTGELVAFETVTDMGGGVFRLNNVWRDILDTARRKHTIGERVWFLSGLTWPIDAYRVGTRSFPVADTVSTKIVPRSNNAALTPDEIDAVGPSTVRGRTALPFPAADYLLSSSRAIAQLAEEGLRPTWKRRQYSTPTIVRSDAASETPDSDVRYRMLGQKIKVDGSSFAEVNTSPGGTDVNGTGTTHMHLGDVGHGEIDAKLRTVKTVGSDVSWQDPTIRVTAPHWRNLLLNPRFDGEPGGDGTSNLAKWITVTGTPTSLNTAGEQLGKAGRFLAFTSSAGTTAEVTQTVSLLGYGTSARMTARLRFYGHNLGTATSTLRVYLELLNAADAVVGTVDTGAVTPSNSQWERYDIAVAWVATATKARVRVTSDSGEEFDPPAAVVTEFRLTLGDTTANLLTNPQFESALASWTTALGGFTAVGTIGYLGGIYARGSGAAATDEIYQEVTVTAGHEANSTAIVEAAVARDSSDTDDTGEIIVEARNAGGSVLSSVSSGVLAPSGGDLVFERERLVLELPQDTAAVRVRLRGSHINDAGPANVVFDDIDLALHKHLAPAAVVDAKFEEPVQAPMPQSWTRWWQDVGFVPPLYGMWNGEAFTSVAPASSPVMVNNGAVTAREFVGGYYTAPGEEFGEFNLTDCYEVDAGDFHTVDSQHYANFSRAVAFACSVDFRIDPRSFSAVTGCGIAGRRGVSRGWALDVRATGVVRATILGASATLTLDSAASVIDGRWHRATIMWIPGSPPTFVLIVDGVSLDSTTDTATCGEFGTLFSDPCSFRIGRARAADTLFAGQLARVGLWYGTVGTHVPTPAQLTGAWTHGADPSGLLDANGGTQGATEVGTCYVVAGDEFRLVRYGTKQFFMSYLAAMEEGQGAGKGWGLAISRGFTNRANSDFTDAAKWGAGASATITQGIRDAEGFKHGVRLEGDNGADRTIKALALALDSTVDTRVSMIVRRPFGEDEAPFRIELRNTSGVLIGSGVVTNQLREDWIRVDCAFAWDDSTANAELWIYASNDGTTRQLEISGPVVVHQGGAFYPMVLPAASSPTAMTGVGYTIADMSPLDAIFHDGEMRVSGFCAHVPEAAGHICDVGPDSGLNDRRAMHVNSTADALFTLWNATGSGTTSEVVPDDEYWNQVDYGIFTIRTRWSRARLLLDTEGLTFATLYGALYFADNDGSGAVVYGDNDLTAIFTVGELDTLYAQLGTDRLIGWGADAPLNALIRRWTISSREEERYPT